MEVLQAPFNVKVEDVLRKMRVKPGNDRIESVVRELVEKARPIARPKAVYEVSYIDSKEDDTVTIAGVKFASHVLRVNLDKVERVFPYVCTCGREMDALPFTENDLMISFCYDAIKELAVQQARSYMEEYLTKRFALGQMSRMAPGAGAAEDWPITQQKQLFSIFGDVQKLIGVKLTDTFLMIPIKSVSGIFFPTEVRFESCQLCPREQCIGRRAPFDATLAKQYRGEGLGH
jgi:hypothetical protein